MPTPRPPRFRRRAALPLAASALLAACSDPAATGPSGKLTGLPRALTAAELQAVGAGNGFTFGLLREVNAQQAWSNVFISPLSASMALGMTANGAAGETEAAMRRTLGIGGGSAQEMNEAYRGLTKLLLSLDPAVKVGVANSIWYRTGFPVLPSFVDASRTYFDAEVTAANFDPATVGRINDWAKSKTNGKIEKVIDGLSDDDVMILMNALYFKGSWRSRFDPSRTHPAPFTRPDGSVVQASAMTQEKMPIRFGGLDGATVGELPYGNGAFVMTVVLPPRGTSVDAFVASLDAAKWEQLLASMREGEFDVTLPKFRLKFEDKLNDPLTKLGMGVAFDPIRADFSRIASGGGLFISFVKQNTFVDVNEEGTEAAAVTTVGVKLVSLPPALVVDRPFVFAIRERFSGAILFIGKIGDPTAT